MKKIFFTLLVVSLAFVGCDSDDDTTSVSPDAGVLSGGPFTFLVDGTPDMVTGITTDADAVGTNSSFIITDADGSILGLPPTLEALNGVDFDGAGVGSCAIYYLRYETISGLEAGSNINDLTGDFDTSNSIIVTRDQGANAGVLTGDNFVFCVDGTPDMVNGISTDPDAVGTNRTFVITDADGTILGLPPGVAELEGVDFDGAGAGVCLIWYLRYEDGLTGLTAGENVDGLNGVFSFSNSISVTRNEPIGGAITGGPFNFTVDGTPDMVSGIALDGTQTGSLKTWVITDDAGNVLGLPPTLEALEGVDFDGAGTGVCLIWYLRYEDGLQGLEAGENVVNLDGCYNFSNSISVTRS